MEAPKKIDIPIDYDNEAVILSNAIKNSKNRDVFSKLVEYTEFRHREHQVIAWSINDILHQGLTCSIDTILIRSKFAPVKFPIDFEYVSDVVNNYDEIPESNFNVHLSKLRLDKTKEELSNFYFTSIYNACLNPATDISFLEERLNYARDIVNKNVTTTQSTFLSMSDLVDNFYEQKKTKDNFKSTGFINLDSYLTEGYKPRGITILCGLPGSGKSSMLLSSMYSLSHTGVWCPQFAMEMDGMAITTKLAAYASNISVTRIAKEWENFNATEKRIVEYELERLKRNPYLLINDTPGQSLKAIREQIMVLQDKLQTEYMFASVDLFGKIKEFQQSDSFAKDYEQQLNRTQAMAKELGVNFGLVAQINRGATQRRNNEPRMSDLKNAGAWEEVADLILATHRPSYHSDAEFGEKEEELNNRYKSNFYEDEDNPFAKSTNVLDDLESHSAEVLILKQRMGEANISVRFIFDPNTTRYVPLSQKDQVYLDTNKNVLQPEA